MNLAKEPLSLPETARLGQAGGLRGGAGRSRVPPALNFEVKNMRATFFVKALWRHSLHLLGPMLTRLGLKAPLSVEDRRVLERVIFPYFLDREEFQHVLFIGCDFYTWHYARWFVGREYWTIDVDPEKRRYGSGRHLIDSATHLNRHFLPWCLDLIVCNGVFGWGLNDRRDVEEVLGHCDTLLRPGGVLVFGWDDVPAYRPYEVRESLTACGLQPFVFPPLGDTEVLTETKYRHVFSFLRKPQVSP
jgi:GNAT superfamily N-acetyltransferase